MSLHIITHVVSYLRSIMHMHFYCYLTGGSAYLLDRASEWCYSDSFPYPRLRFIYTFLIFILLYSLHFIVLQRLIKSRAKRRFEHCPSVSACLCVLSDISWQRLPFIRYCTCLNALHKTQWEMCTVRSEKVYLCIPFAKQAVRWGPFIIKKKRTSQLQNVMKAFSDKNAILVFAF